MGRSMRAPDKMRRRCRKLTDDGIQVKKCGYLRNRCVRARARINKATADAEYLQNKYYYSN